jgi:glycosyltransferase involved in cell wall biosynthesis
VRVLLINDHLQTLGGAEIYLQQINQALQSKGIQTSTLSFNKKKRDITDVRSLRERWTQLKRSCLHQNDIMDHLKQKIDEFQPDIIHLNKNKLYTNSIFHVLRKQDIPVIHTLHDGTDAIFHHSLKAKIQKHILRPYPSNIHYIVPSEHYYRRLKRKRVNKVHHIPHFIEIDKWPLRKSKDIQAKQLLFVGRLDRTKGIYHLLNAMKIVVAKDPGVQLICIGTGKEAKAFKQRIFKLRLQNNVQLLGFHTQETILEFFHHSTIFLYPSNYDEMFGITGLEAQAAGIPVIASDIGGIKEWCIDLQTGLLVPPGKAQPLAEKILNLLAYRPLQQLLSKKARQHVQDFYSIDYAVNKLIQLYQHLQKQNQPSGIQINERI